jgi:hypothetical protein
LSSKKTSIILKKTPPLKVTPTRPQPTLNSFKSSSLSPLPPNKTPAILKASKAPVSFLPLPRTSLKNKPITLLFQKKAPRLLSNLRVTVEFRSLPK